MRPPYLIVVALVLSLAGWKTYGHVRNGRTSPFALWDFRAGMRFAALDEGAYRQTKRRFECHPIVRSARLCQLEVTGIKGVVRVLVDSTDRAALIQFLPDTASALMREEGRRLAAEWSRAGRSERDAWSRRRATDPQAGTTRWTSGDGRWVASMTYGELGSTPVAVQLSEGPTLEGIRALAPLGPIVLLMNQLAESDGMNALREGMERAMALVGYGNPADKAVQTPAPGPSDARLPVCVEAVPDFPLPGMSAARDGVDSQTVAMLERAVPVVYPGSRLLHEGGFFVVDSTGRSERLALGPGDVDRVAGVAIFAVRFPTRSVMAERRLADGRPERFCSAPAEVLFMRGGKDGMVAEAHRVIVDHEALASEISRLTLSPRSFDGDPAHVQVRYRAVYAGAGWTGSIDWEAIVAGDPPRATVRVPLAFSQRGRNVEGVQAGTVVLTGRPAGGVELSTLEQYDWGVSTRTFVVPVDASGVLHGTRVLGKLSETP